MINVKNYIENIILTKYNNVFSESDFYEEYSLVVNYIISKHPTLSLLSESDTSVLFYRDLIMYSYDVNYVNGVYTKRFDTFLNNIINLGFGNGIPIVKYAKSTEVVSESAYTPIVVKLTKPLDQDIEINTRMYISGLYYSDDLYFTTILNKTSIVPTKKLRQPDLTLVSTSRGTKEYNQEDLIENVSDDVNQYFNTSTSSDLSLNVDYSDFNNFVKYSSAKSRIDSFLFKMTNYSVIVHKIKNLEKEIYNLQYETSIGNIEAKISENSIRLLRTLEISKENKKKMKF